MAREMKDSGVEWIGEIPKDWKVLKNKNCFTLRKEIVGNSFEEYDLLSLTKLGIKIKDKNDFRGKVPENYGTYQNVKKGELVLCLFDLDCSAVFSGLSKYNGMISPAYKVYNCKKNIFNNFAKYWFEYCFIDRKYKIYSKSLRYVVNSDDFGGIEMAVPSMEEQEKIVNYLDKKVADIDLIIEKTKATIEDYKKYKQSIITEAVTKGLNPNVEMKDSGIEWIGQIPKHWKKINPKALFYQRKDRAKKDDRQLTASQKYGIMYQDEFMEKEGVRVTVVQKDFDILKHVEPNDFVISMRSFQGGLEYSELSGCISSAYVMLIPNLDKVYPKFFKFFFKSFKYINALQSTSNLVRDGQAMRYSNFSQLYLVEIPLEEQKEIADYLDKKVSEIDNLISKKESLINEMEEYKKSLIYECVTGKKEIV